MDKLTIAEYDLLMEAVELRLVDEDYRLHRQAYLNFSAQATKKTGNSIRPVYKKFKDFYDYNKELKKVESRHKRDSGRFLGLSRLIKQQKGDK